MAQAYVCGLAQLSVRNAQLTPLVAKPLGMAETGDLWRCTVGVREMDTPDLALLNAHGASGPSPMIISSSVSLSIG